jgi:hypothetical protein
VGSSVDVLMGAEDQGGGLGAWWMFVRRGTLRVGRYVVVRRGQKVEAVCSCGARAMMVQVGENGRRCCVPC